jgi:hypothetical protein
MSTKKWTELEILQAVADGKVDEVSLEYGSDFGDEGVQHNLQVMEDLVEEAWVRGNTKYRTGSGEFVLPNFRITEAGKSKLGSSKFISPSGNSTIGFDAKVFTVMIASPSDTADERNLVEKAVHRWNADHSWSKRILLLPIRYEVDAVPQTGADGQNIINSQLVDRADIVVALFCSRMGAKTPRAGSGTEEEIMRADARGAKVHIYFSKMGHPDGVDTVQLKNLASFQARIQKTTLYSTFDSHPQLNERIRSALEKDVAEFTS